MKTQKIRVLIADDHPLMRQALRTAIEDESDMQVVGEANNGSAAVTLFHKLRPDVAVMDLLMPECSGLQAMMQIRQTHPDAHLLALTSSNDAAMLTAAVEAGALGYLVKDATRAEILQAIRQVSCGNAFFSAHAASQLAQLVLPHKANGIETLTARERDVLMCIGQGASNKQIAEQLALTESTVRTHVQHILEKLNLENRNQAVLYASHLPPSN